MSVSREQLVHYIGLCLYCKADHDKDPRGPDTMRALAPKVYDLLVEYYAPFKNEASLPGGYELYGWADKAWDNLVAGESK